MLIDVGYLWSCKINLPQEGKIFVGSICIGTSWHIWYRFELFRGEVRRIGVGAEMWHKRRINIPDRIPIDTIEERMSFYLIDIKALFRRSNKPKRWLIKSEPCCLRAGIHFRIKSSASRLRCTSSGKIRCFGQSMIFLYVSCVVCEQNGGYPTRHSNVMAPSDHQSHSLP